MRCNPRLAWCRWHNGLSRHRPRGHGRGRRNPTSMCILTFPGRLDALGCIGPDRPYCRRQHGSRICAIVPGMRPAVPVSGHRSVSRRPLLTAQRARDPAGRVTRTEVSECERAFARMGAWSIGPGERLLRSAHGSSRSSACVAWRSGPSSVGRGIGAGNSLQPAVEIAADGFSR